MIQKIGPTESMVAKSNAGSKSMVVLWRSGMVPRHEGRPHRKGSKAGLGLTYGLLSRCKHFVEHGSMAGHRGVVVDPVVRKGPTSMSGSRTTALQDCSSPTTMNWCRILWYQFFQPAIGGKGQFLKASCHWGGLVRAALKGILWDSAAINSRGSETPTGPRK
jgi:hypothetical protein